MKTVAKSALWLLALAVTLAPTRNLFAQEADDSASAQATEPNHEEYGTTAYREAPDLQAVGVVAISVKPILVEGKASYTTGGVSLRNRGAGNIGVSGLVGAPRITFLYWAVITVGAPGAPDKSIQIQRLNPAPASAAAVLAGALIGTGPAPCWGPQGAIISVFRAPVPPAIATGDGSYQLTLLPGAGGLVNGADPWAAVAFPLFEGASLVMIGNGVGTVSVFDVGLAGKTFAPNPNPFNYVLNLPVAPIAGKRMLLDNIGADGQHGNVTSRGAMTSLSDETTTINGFPIAGPGSEYVDSDWNGSSGLPVTQLWDDTGHDITNVTANSAAPANILNISIKSALAPADCLTPVANVVEED